jgi:Protein NO VEIN, C-terminal
MLLRAIRSRLQKFKKDETWVRKWVAEKETVADVVAAPFQPCPGKLRGYQGYLTKMPLAFLNRWPRLKELADQLSGSSYIQELAAVLQDNEAVLAAVVDDVRQLHGQGFHVSPKARRAIEAFPLERAQRHYEARGYAVEVRGKPFDLRCSNRDTILYVEVKGTTTAGEEILLTPNEVAFADEHSSSMALFIVSDLQVSDGEQPIVSGGTDMEIRPWMIERARLAPIGFSYILSRGDLARAGG